MIVLTGAGGFIGSVVLGYLNKWDRDDIVLFDDLPNEEQFRNLTNKKYISLHSTAEMPSDPNGIEAVIHIGADSSTLQRDWKSLYKTNVLSTRCWNQFCSEHNIPFIFTSSAAVYGNGTGPLNQYAFSKQVSENEINGVVLRLFNVYGPNEYHKGRMASTLFHWYNQAKKDSCIKVFEDSNNYLRDFIYVEDVARVIKHFLDNYQPGVYDVGTGKAPSFEYVARQCCIELGCDKIYIPMPEDLKAQYQTTTCAQVTALKDTGFDVSRLLSVEDGMKLYYNTYLNSNQTY